MSMKRVRSESFDGDQEEEEEYRGNKKKKKKKSKIANKNKIKHGPNPPPDMPVEFKNRILEMGGSEVKLVIQKALYDTDLSPGHSRFSMPSSQIREEFLRDEEKEKLALRDGKNTAKMDVLLIEPNLEAECKISLRRWDMKKPIYVLNGTIWIEVKKRNHRETGMIMQLWSFRVDEELHLALIKLPGGGRGGDHGDILGEVRTSSTSSSDPEKIRGVLN